MLVRPVAPALTVLEPTVGIKFTCVSASAATPARPAAFVASAESASAVPTRVIPGRCPRPSLDGIGVGLALAPTLFSLLSRSLSSVLDLIPSSDSWYQGARITASSSISPSFLAADAASREGDISGARAGATLPRATIGALNMSASPATLSVHTRHIPHSTCLLARGLSSFSLPYVPSRSPLLRTSSATPEPSASTRTLSTSPHSPPSSAHRFAAATEHRRGSACVGRQSEMSITG
mmetsp:Transcript_29634/g.74013  ORF Transcript_29634/g.74013 Transcript_29634/m.74013 type:complete len:236 (-) Transcript_29634:3626-4333(-)